MSLSLPELLVPAGNLSKLRTAFAYGADAVYVGAAGLSMRPDEAAFRPEQLREAVQVAHAQDKRVYVAVNMMMFEANTRALKHWIAQTADIDFDAVIVSDPGAFLLLRQLRPGLRLHISTQAATANPSAAAFWKAQGASRVILARECTLEHARAISVKGDIEVEVFVHGAMCVAISGRCLLSAHLCGRSGSQGECKHSCRWDWSLVEAKRPGELITAFETAGQTVFLGSKDLCLVEHIPPLVQSGIASLKIEGRMKSEYYVATVTRVYRDALDRYADDPVAYEVKPRWIEELHSFSHRPYCTGFAFGYPHSEPESLQSHSHYANHCDILGIVDRTEGPQHVVQVKNPSRVGETVEWIGPAMSGGRVRVTRITGAQGEAREQSHCGTVATFEFGHDVSLPAQAILVRRA